MKYEIKFTSKFKKDLKRAEKQRKKLDKLFEVIEILARGDVLPERFRDHELSGDYKNARECHIEPDWLLVYEYFDDVLVLLLSRLGSHSELF
ncbi:MAG: type II toxin-antitoxin system YafQ family toxin [Oscillospiraceae bacterium]|nr:type II toxin-antitoxin system YafQ family toxin [Oscillospiraceae bacterium]MBR2181343.1 type II toxin-antitoxin system YafQ family toxin [Oscillospiraceae bacterium]